MAASTFVVKGKLTVKGDVFVKRYVVNAGVRVFTTTLKLNKATGNFETIGELSEEQSGEDI